MAETSSSSSGGLPEPKSSQEVIQLFQAMKQEIDQLSGKINELDGESQEHDLVLKALEPMDPKRKCFRLIGGVLVERTVAEVMPAVKNNMEKLQQLIAKLEEQRETKNSQLSAFQTKYKIRAKSQGEDAEPDAKDEAGASQGVLA